MCTHRGPVTSERQFRLYLCRGPDPAPPGCERGHTQGQHQVCRQDRRVAGDRGNGPAIHQPADAVDGVADGQDMVKGAGRRLERLLGERAASADQLQDLDILPAVNGQDSNSYATLGGRAW